MYPHISYRESTGHAWVNCLLHCWPVVGSCLVAGQAASNPALLLGCLDLPDAGWKAEHAQRVSSALSSALLLALALAVGAGPPPPTPTTPPLLHASRQPAAVERTPCLGFRCLGRRTLRAPRTLRFTAGGRCHRARRCWRRRGQGGASAAEAAQVLAVGPLVHGAARVALQGRARAGGAARVS